MAPCQNKIILKNFRPEPPPLVTHAKIFFISLQMWFHVNDPVVHRKNFKRLYMGDKVPPCSVSNILDNYWLRTVTRISLSCTAIQAESNELFGVIIKRILSRYLESFKCTLFAVFLEMSSCRGCGAECDIWSLT